MLTAPSNGGGSTWACPVESMVIPAQEGLGACSWRSVVSEPLSGLGGYEHLCPRVCCGLQFSTRRVCASCTDLMVVNGVSPRAPQHQVGARLPIGVPNDRQTLARICRHMYFSSAAPGRGSSSARHSGGGVETTATPSSARHGSPAPLPCFTSEV